MIARFTTIDPHADKHLEWSPFAYVYDDPIKHIDPDGQDGIVTIKGGQITVSSNVYLYGAGATKGVAAQMQGDINKKWGGGFSAKSANGKQSFKVNVKVNVALYEGKEKNDPLVIPQSWNPFNRDNFVEVGAGDKRSYASGGDEGEWRSQGRDGSTLAQDDPAAHELGHILGLADRYTDDKGIDKGWENNIMGDSQNGKVDQRNIDGVLKDALKAYDTWSKDKNNKGKTFTYGINSSNPSN
ncbi:MAG TPA: hypothetical protein DCO83_00385 [Mucilaginibacter sp.]|nr:hypothetical protein [Mucilaginibacter sp.]